MKKSFRKGSQQQPNKVKSQDKSKSQGKRQVKNARGLRDVLGIGDAPEAGPSFKSKKGQQASRDQKGRSGNDEFSHRTNKSSRRRDEKPSRGEGQRGLADRRSTAQSRPEAQGQTSRSNKLTYIMTFEPPGQKSERQNPISGGRESKRVSDIRPEPTIDSPRRYSTSAAPASAPFAEHPLAEVHTKADFKWPKDRVKKSTTDDKTPQGRRSKHGANRIQGIVKRHPDGFGFLIPDDSTHPDVYISRQFMTGVMTNDRVEIEVYQSRKEDKYFGEIIRVVSRSSSRIVGRYLPVDQKYGVILDENRGWGTDLRIPSNEAMGAKEGDMVAVEITQYPEQNREFRGRVVGLLGDANDPINDVKRVVYSQGIPEEFSLKALEDARRFGGIVTEAEMRGREDLRGKNLITIDGVTARDFDDAIYVEPTSRGFHLIVGIADVSHYVKPGTSLDQEAYERGTSTYFPNYVVPMLPEELSNELCSLKPHVPRLCFASEIKLNFNGEIENYRFFEAVMESKARVTYGEAQEVIDGVVPEKLKSVAENILAARDLAKILMAKRFREGSLDLEIPETQVVVDASGETVDIVKSERLFAHRLIEELMLVTNICTARFLDENSVPGIYRVHEEPNEDNIRALQRFLWNLGGTRSVMGSDLQKKLTKALQGMEGKPGAQVLNMLTLRAMNQAQYSNENIGHFGLGFSHYTHFTSPIRRYPDLIAHRLIKSRLYPRYRSMQMNDDELASASTFLSACEQRSVKAERQVVSIKKARFMMQYVGQEFEGVISSVAKFGVFVLLRQFDVDGLVKVENLGNDRFIFDEEGLRLIGQRRGLRYTIGDKIRVLVAAADPIQGRIDLTLAQEAKPESGDGETTDESFVNEFAEEKPSGARKANKFGEKSRGDVQKRGQAKNNRRGVRKERVSRRRRKD